jgi:hypothetical protein
LSKFKINVLLMISRVKGNFCQKNNITINYNRLEMIRLPWTELTKFCCDPSYYPNPKLFAARAGFVRH